MDELADLDEITMFDFASVYRSFKDVSELEPLEANYRTRRKIDETQYAFRILKIIFFHRQGLHIGAVLPAYFGRRKQ